MADTIIVNAELLKWLLANDELRLCPWEMACGCPYWGDGWATAGKCPFTGKSGMTYEEICAQRAECWAEQLREANRP
jgi:hypothetical protein